MTGSKLDEDILVKIANRCGLADELTYESGKYCIDTPKFSYEMLAQQILALCESEWIPVSQGLPDKRGDYLAFSRSTTGVAWMFFNTTRNTWTSGDDYITNVTHWMPLPDPPENSNDLL